MPPVAEFVTVAEGAQILAVSLRTAQRHAAKLAPTDRQEADTDTTTGRHVPPKVRLSALAVRLGKAVPVVPADTIPAPETVGDSDAPPPRQPVTNESFVMINDRQSRDSDATGTEGAIPASVLIEQLRGQVAGLETDKVQLWDALQRSQENERAALAQLDQARREYGIMIAATAAGRIAAPVASGDTQSDDTASGGVSTPSDSSQGNSEGEAQQKRNKNGAGNEPDAEQQHRHHAGQGNSNKPATRRWWQFWKGGQ